VNGTSTEATEPARPSVPTGGRHIGIDALRGFAVVIMVGANMVPYLLEEPYPLWLRAVSSLAAPTFVMLAGFMVGQGSASKSYGIWHYLKRSAVLLLVAALIDYLIWGATPFRTFDVLYLIALVLPAASAARRLSRPMVLACAALIFALTQPLQHLWGYGRDVSHPVWERVHALLLDGWFPVFPWLGVGLVGAVIGAMRREASDDVLARGLPRAALACLAIGLPFWWLTHPEFPTRHGYAELFYPPALAFFLSAIGVDLLLVALILRIRHGSLSRILAVYGRASLVIYVVHLAVIAFVINRFIEVRGWIAFLLSYGAHVLLLWGLARVISRRPGAARRGPSSETTQVSDVA
jgi:uncharacterized membrane protein